MGNEDEVYRLFYPTDQATNQEMVLSVHLCRSDTLHCTKSNENVLQGHEVALMLPPSNVSASACVQIVTYRIICLPGDAEC